MGKFKNTEKSELFSVINESKIHWLLLHLRDNTLHIYDSLGLLKEADEYISSLKDWLSKHADRPLVLEFHSETVYQKDDAHNCGVWVIHFAKCIILGEPFQEDFAVEKYRVELCQKLTDKYFPQKITNEKSPQKMRMSPVHSLGLKNLGNSCWLNSVVQGLLSLSFFKKAMVFFGHIETKKINSINLVTKLMVDYQAGKQLNTQALLKWAQKKMKIATNTQQDSSQFFDKLCHSMSSKWPPQRFMPFPILGQWMIQVKCCNCDAPALMNPQAFHSMLCSVDIADTDFIYPIQYFIDEKIFREHSFTRPCVCGFKRSLETYCVNFRPQCLTVVMQRFEYTHLGTKITTDVDPMKKIRVSGKEYHLTAIIEHHGDEISCGHFTCTRKLGDDWAIFSDENVEIVSFDEITKQGYMFFFEMEESEAKKSFTVGPSDK